VTMKAGIKMKNKDIDESHLSIASSTTDRIWHCQKCGSTDRSMRMTRVVHTLEITH
jgi:hypothetical protein